MLRCPQLKREVTVHRRERGERGENKIKQAKFPQFYFLLSDNLCDLSGLCGGLNYYVNLNNLIISIPAILYALTIHEYFHGWTANKFGDPTARLQGRLTLNPLAHIDIIGALCFIFAHFGWGKPVPVNPHNFRNPRRDNVIVSFAGPASNFVSAFYLA